MEPLARHSSFKNGVQYSLIAFTDIVRFIRAGEDIGSERAQRTGVGRRIRVTVCGRRGRVAQRPAFRCRLYQYVSKLCNCVIMPDNVMLFNQLKNL